MLIVERDEQVTHWTGKVKWVIRCMDNGDKNQLRKKQTKAAKSDEGGTEYELIEDVLVKYVDDCVGVRSRKRGAIPWPEEEKERRAFLRLLDLTVLANVLGAVTDSSSINEEEEKNSESPSESLSDSSTKTAEPVVGLTPNG